MENQLIDIVDRMNEAIARLNEVFLSLIISQKDLEKKLDFLQVQLDSHEH